MADFIPEEQNELYVRALKKLDSVGRQSEYHKVPETREETELMKRTNQAISSHCFAMPNYRQGQFELIFANPLARKAHIHDLNTGECGEIQAWQAPHEILACLNREGEYIA